MSCEILMKIIAMYLPQFHRVKENDEWWGEGFTEWVATKNAKPLFEGHYQPHIPLGENYYNLLDKKTMEWQAGLMHQYGVDGMCMYHYWFKDGKRILEKPAENLLKWQDIDMPFCFSWANQTWARSWSKIPSANTWSDLQEPIKKEGDKAILLEQVYGEKEQWKQHFEYLLPFFKDKRYIKVEGKPLFLIYKTGLIPCLDDMLECWSELAQENGFPGIFIIGSHCTGREYNVIDAELIHEPADILFKYISTGSSRTDVAEYYDYDMVWRQILQSEPRGIKTYFGGIVGYDDTPRRGVGGVVFHNQTPEIFCKYFTQLLAKNDQNGNDMVFLNAWNEWGEGMHLEPDQKNGYAYLNAVKEAKSKYQDVALIKDNTENLELKMLRIQCNKVDCNVHVFDSWMRVKEKKQSLVSYFEHHGYYKIAMYGYGMLGRHFVSELENTCISLQYIIDQKGERLKASVPIYSLNAKLPEVDVVVISIAFDIDIVKKELRKKGVKRIVTLEEVIDGTFQGMDCGQ